MAIETVTTDCPNLPDPAHYGLPPEMADYMSQYNTVIIGLFGTYKDDVDTVIAGVNTNIETFDEYIRHDGTTDLTGDWTISANSIALTAGTLTAFTANVTDEASGYQIDGIRVLSIINTQTLVVGEGAGAATPGNQNTFGGYYAGAADGGHNNSYWGSQAGRYNLGRWNVAIGDEAGKGGVGSNYDKLTAVGQGSAISLTDGIDNSVFGQAAARLLTSGSSGIFIGTGSGAHFTTQDGILMIDAYGRTGLTASKEDAIIYGIMKSTGGGTENQVLNFNVGAMNIGTIRDSDVVLTFKTSGNEGILTWKRVEDHFLFADDIAFANGEFVVFDKAAGSGVKIDPASPDYGWADIIGDQLAKNTGATKPTLTAYNGDVEGYQFGNGDRVFLTYHIPHDYVIGTDVHLHIHWSENTGNATGGTIDFKYFAVYAKGWNQATGSTFTSTPITASFSSIDINDGASGLNQYQQHITEVIISGPSATAALFDRDDLEPDGIIELTLEMDTNSLTGGGVGNPFIHVGDLHYQTTGHMGTKSRDFNFYT